MLVLSRQRDESILIGDDRTAAIQLSEDEEQQLRECQDPALIDIAKRILDGLGKQIELTVVDIRGDKTRLGITAPRSTPVHRREVYNAIKRERESARKGPTV